MSNKYENQMIGVNVRRFRVKRQMTEVQLAIAVSKSHRRISVNSVKALEQGIYRPSPYRVYYLAKVLGVSMEELFQ